MPGRPILKRTSCRQGSVITVSSCHVDSLCNCRLKHESESFTEKLRQGICRRNRRERSKGNGRKQKRNRTLVSLQCQSSLKMKRCHPYQQPRS